MKRQKQAGFTLIELSIVLIVIGLIVGGVLAGQQITQNARINNTVSAIQSYQSAVQTYNQTYGALPGDDNHADKHFPNSSLTDGGGDGVIGTTQSYDKTGTPTTGDESESQYLWSHLRAAQLIKGGADPNTQPLNAFNGIYGIQNGAFGFSGTNVLCFNKVPGTAASALDAKLDDGNPATGTLRAAKGNAASADATTSYDSGDVYVLCTPL